MRKLLDIIKTYFCKGNYLTELFIRLYWKKKLEL